MHRRVPCMTTRCRQCQCQPACRTTAAPPSCPSCRRQGLHRERVQCWCVCVCSRAALALSPLEHTSTADTADAAAGAPGCWFLVFGRSIFLLLLMLLLVLLVACSGTSQRLDRKKPLCRSTPDQKSDLIEQNKMAIKGHVLCFGLRQATKAISRGCILPLHLCHTTTTKARPLFAARTDPEMVCCHRPPQSTGAYVS